LFCSYGNPGERPLDYDSGTPLRLPDNARITLTPYQKDASDPQHPPIGLLFTEEEFNEALSRYRNIDGKKIRMDEELRLAVYDWTMGHAGAVNGLLNVMSMNVSLPAV
jgi:hypothetical protein